jgi:hypothetical protein
MPDFLSCSRACAAALQRNKILLPEKINKNRISLKENDR